MILDIQGFKIENNKFIVKELAAYDGKKICHFIFRAPFSEKLLPPNIQKQNLWLTKNHHGLRWEEGVIPYFRLKSIIEELSRHSVPIYVKGREKADFIRTFIKSENVLEFAEHPKLQSYNPKCLYHSLNSCICALSNVYKLHENFCMS